MAELLLRYEIWIIAGLLLIAVDILIGLDFVLLSFGVGAFAAGGSLLLQDFFPVPYTNSWEAMLTFFAIFSIAILVPLRRFARRPAKNGPREDINKY
jgi:membrane protein implicated in regulation of membrane protease activity